jgi:hypothetical protein
MGKLNNLNDFHAVLNFIFSFEYYKFRPVSYLQYVIEYLFFGNNYNGYVFYNICLVMILNYIFLQFIKEQSVVVCIMLSLVLVTSKLLIYPVWNITGSFETLAAILFLLIVLTTFSDVSSKNRLTILSFMLICTSERYLPFLVALPVIYHYKNSQDNFITSIWYGLKYAAVILLAYFVFRYSFGVPLIVGTQTDNVIESFSGIRVFTNTIKAYVEIFGFSDGPMYLTGFEFVDWVPFGVLRKNSLYINGLYISSLLFVVSLYYFVFKCYFFKKETFLYNIISLILIIAASITFRLELRWLLASYLMLLILFTQSTHQLGPNESNFNLRGFDRTLFYTFIFLSIIYNVYYAVHFRHALYFAEKLHQASIFTSLASFLHR